jgi:hypothetical protein
VAATLAISIAKLAAAALAILVIATPLKLTTLIVLVIAAPLKRNACKAIRGRAASSASWSDYIKGVLGELVNLIAKKF